MLKMLLGMLCAMIASGCFTAAWAQDAPAVAENSAKTEFFERQVRPLLAQHCYACHGEKKQESSLRVDSRAGLLKGGDNGPAIDLENPAASRLLKAIRHDDPDLQMPPEPAAKLPDAAIAAIARWITDGTHWPAETARRAPTPAEAAKSHWAFQPPQPPAIPAVRQTDWPRSPVDHFVLTRLEEQGMTPSAAADRATLIRRSSIDLVGLPPSAAEVAAFVADSAPDAFARVVDRLLESPQYGERWGRYWLDVARYADTKGYVRLAEERRFHYAYTYRDYVIRAFNEDLPYDRFVVEQLAADQLPVGDDRRSLAALGFLTLGRQFTSNKYDVIDDRIDVVTRGLLGLTVTCARCHDHKYDPIPTADYYSLYGVFASSEDPIVPPLMVTPGADATTQAFQLEFEKRKQALDEYEPKQYAALLNELRENCAGYLDAALAGRVPLQQPLPIWPGEIRQLVVNRWLDYIEATDKDDPVFGPWHALTALAAQKPGDFAAAAAGLVEQWKALPDGATGKPINALVKKRLIGQPPKSMADVARAYGELLTQTHRQWQSLLASTTAAGSGVLERLPEADAEALRQVLYGPDSPVAMSVQEAFAQYQYDAPIHNEITARRNAINQHLANTAQAPPRANTLVECAVPFEPHIFVRGNPTRPGPLVPRQFLHVLSHDNPQPFAIGSGRLELARAVASRDNPLTARVLVNRVWAHHFGAGLVRTPSNFGLRGQPPTHPELLDYLATRFVDEGWSIKKLHRWIMLSSTYQQSSHDRAEYQARDPENRLLWKMNRRRLDFESLRDGLLLAAGRLDLAAGGPSVDISSITTNRRTVYALVDRQGLPGMLPAFDFASPDAHSAERYTTTVPQQALFLMNSPMLVEMARAFAARPDVKNIETNPARVARMVEIAWGRKPTERETQLALEYIATDQGTPAASGSLDAWEAFAQTLLLSNEFIYVE